MEFNIVIPKTLRQEKQLQGDLEKTEILRLDIITISKFEITLKSFVLEVIFDGTLIRRYVFFN